MKKTRTNNEFAPSSINSACVLQKAFELLALVVLKLISIIFIISLGACSKNEIKESLTEGTDISNLKSAGIGYYIDSDNGSDINNGTSDTSPWKTLAKIQSTNLYPGDIVKFKRGSSYTGPFFINYSGTIDNYITVTDYGNAADPAPQFTNPVFAINNWGNCIKIAGDYVIVENLYFHDTAAMDVSVYLEPGGAPDGGWYVWEMGAVHIDRGSDYCIVLNNEFNNCVAGIRSCGKFALIKNNYIHDCNRAMRNYNWGPIGIWLGQDFQTVTNNTIINMQVVDSDPNHFVNGIGGGAFEIDDGRYNKYNILISHNFTRGNAGFLETVFDDVQADPLYKDWKITFNVSDDFQAFTKLRYAKTCNVDNNTILRRKVNANELGVFLLKGDATGNTFRNNIIMTKYDVTVFNVVGNYSPGSFIKNNHYYAIGNLVLGTEGSGVEPTYGDVKFVDISGTTATDFSIVSTSPAKNTGRELGYLYDYSGYPIPYGNYPDRGAFEYHP